jgi:hypothetical protein
MSAVMIGGVVATASAGTVVNTKPISQRSDFDGVPLMRMGDEGTNSAQLDGKKVWNVRKGYNTISVAITGIARGSGYYYDADNNKIAVPERPYAFRESGSVTLECLRTVHTNSTRKILLPVKNPYRCRVTVNISTYQTTSDAPAGTFPAGSTLTHLDVDSTLLTATVKSVRCNCRALPPFAGAMEVALAPPPAWPARKPA